MLFLRFKQSLLALAMGLAMLAITWLALTGIASPNVKAASPKYLQMPPLRFLDDTDPITDEVRLLCYATSAPGSLIADLVVETNTDGEPSSPLPPKCNYLAAMHLEHRQDSGKPDHPSAYDVYATSWPPGSTTPLPAVGDISIQDEWPLVLFNVVVSLEWEPEPASTYRAEFLDAWRQASAFLYDWTEGQMAIGSVSIHTNGHNWIGADARGLVNNDYRPTAYIGGMVSDRTPVTFVKTVSSTVYAPAAIYLGRYWDRDGPSDASSGRWNMLDGPPVLAHEWAHYALFFSDEYVGPSGARHYCTCDQLPDVGLVPDICDGVTSDLAASPLAWPYPNVTGSGAGELWHPGAPQKPPMTCEKTRQWQIAGQSDWEFLVQQWYGIQGLSGLPPLDFPDNYNDLDADGPALGLAGDLFGRMPGDPVDFRVYLPLIHRGGGGGTPPEPGLPISILITDSLEITETPLSQVYVLKGIEPVMPERILHQGKAIGPSSPTTGFLGTVHLLGVDPEDHFRISVDRYTTESSEGMGGRYVYSDIVSGGAATVVADEVGWQASLDATYELSGSLLTTMTVVLTSPSPPDLILPPTAQLCSPDANIGCHSEKMEQVGPTTWTATFTPLAGSDELPLYGVVRVQAEGVGELIRWFQVAGGVGPAHNGGDAPVADGPVTVNPNNPIPTPNRVIVMPAADYQALTTSLGTVKQGTKPVQGFLEQPYDIDIVPTLPVSFTLTLFYNQDTITRLEQQLQISINESDLPILHFSGGQWLDLTGNVVGRDTDHNWIAFTAGEDGLYGIGLAP